MELPKEITAGKSFLVQIAPFGDFASIMKTPSLNGQPEKEEPVIQHMDAQNFARIADASNTARKVLVDFDHRSMDPHGSTEAAAWATGIRMDPKLGLVADFSFTDAGAAAINSQRYRYVSPVFQMAETKDGIKAVKVVSVALTNTPNLPVRCVLNRALPGTQPVEAKEQKDMDTKMLATLLNLPETAKPEEIAAAIKALKDQLAAEKNAAMKTEANACADKNAKRICNREAFVKLYIADKTSALGMLGCLKEPAAEAAKVVDSKTAQAPVIAHSAAGAVDARATLAALPPKDRAAYYEAHRQEIDAPVIVQ